MEGRDDRKMKKYKNILFLSFVVVSMFLMFTSYNQSQEMKAMSKEIELLHSKNDDYKKSVNQLTKKVNELNTIVEKQNK